MTTSIGKLSKSVFVKILVGIIILPFVFWGMGDVFRGGNQNVIATIDSKKLSTQEFTSYLNRLNLNEQQIKDITKTDLIEKILSEYIGRKVMALEIERSGITIEDNSLRDIIKNDKLFFKNNKFSRIEYEKFLLKSGVSAPTFESNIVEQESRRQLLSSLAGGIVVPDILIENAFNQENQIKSIKYIDLEKYHSNKEISQKKIDDLYERNKKIFTEEFKSIEYAEITPQILADTTEYNELFFKQLDILENKVLDGETFENITKENSLKIIKINNVNVKKKDRNNKKLEKLKDNIFNKIYSIKNKKTPELIKVENKYFLAVIKSIENNIKSKNDPEVLQALKSQINFQNKIEKNTSILKDISLNAFDKSKMEIFANKNELQFKNYKISNLKQNEIFSEGIIKRIFSMKNDEIDLITNSTLSKNFLVLAVNTKYLSLDKSSEKFKVYEAKARLNLVNKIYKSFDDQLNNKYKVELNQKTIDRVKNSF
tara:strand:+ start:14 stop:1468 length:1455 start_codon:yes stop_codon:yes gene_type:complete